MYKEKITDLLRNLSEEEKYEIAIKASKAGLSIEKDVVPALCRMMELFDDSVIAKNISFMKKK